MHNCIIFQEQINLIAEKVAGMDPDDCDTFRRTLTKRSMVKKDSAMAEFDALKGQFVEGCMEHSGLTKEKGEELFETLRYFSGYGFNLSVAYNTPIKTYTSPASQVTIKRLDEVHPGDFVDSRCEATGDSVRVPVIANHDHGNLPVFEVELDSGQKVACTLDHKFRVADGRMLPLWLIIKENLDLVVCFV